MEEVKAMLHQVLGRLDRVDRRFDGLEGQFKGLEGRFDKLEHRMDEQFTEVKEQLDRIEQSQNNDVIAILERIEVKAINRLDQHDHRIELLNERLLHVEADLRPLTRK